MFKTRFTSLALITAAVALTLAPGAARAQLVRPATSPAPGSMGIPQPEPLITLSIKQKSLGRTLSEVFKQAAPYQYRILALQGPALYSLEADKMPLSQVLKTLLAQDKSKEPMVFYFTRSLAGGGTFTIDREYIEVA
ncbi:MAG TPA: hypothetical protein VFU47_14340, partial [Armatimonadota bacterium]|nr:hypothetical protein [Armatimonadota bacterium]